MTAALAAALAVAVVAVLVLLLSAQRRRRELDRQHRRAEDLQTDLGEARAAISESSRRAENAEKEAAEAVVKEASALEGAAGAERRAHEAEERARLCQQALEARRDDDSLNRPMWELERVRVEREWADLAGPGVALPIQWQPTVGVVVAIELEMIKEVIGTPASLEIDSSDGATTGSASAVAARLSAELVRKLARSGEEMTVEIGPSELTVAHPDGGDLPDLERLIDAAASAGGELRQTVSEGTLVVRLSYP
jgi:hypothetical protein